MSIKPLGDLIDAAFNLREKKRELEAQVKGVNEELSDLELLILQQLEDVGVTTARAAAASATITEQVLPQVTDFEETLEWIGEDFDERKHMLFRRISSGPFKEMLDAGEHVPGVETYVRRKVSIRKLS